MCEDCHQPFDEERQAEFLKKYLCDQENRLADFPDDDEIKKEIERTRGLLDHLAQRESSCETGQ